MKKLIISGCVFIVLVALASCVKEIQVEVPDNHSKLVVSCHLGGGDDLSVNVSASTPLYEESNGEFKRIENATVKISNDKSNWHLLVYDVNFQMYRLTFSSFPISEGNTYYLEVSAPDYETVTGEATVPLYKTLNVSLVKMDTVTDQFGDGALNARFRFTDLTGQANYYGVSAFSFSNGMPTEMRYESAKPWVFSDIQADGKEFVLDFVSSNMNGACDSVQLRVFQTDESFYHFHYSMSMYSGDSNPFAEATPVYSNITNGLGVVSAYSYRDYFFPVNFGKRK